MVKEMPAAISCIIDDENNVSMLILNTVMSNS